MAGISGKVKASSQLIDSLISRADAAKPAILWDSFGLQGSGSGIARYGNELKRALAQAGVEVQILPSWDGFAPFYLPEKWLHSKLGWSSVLGAFLERARPLYGKAIIHGLANCNLPRRPSFFRHFRSVLTVHDLIPLLAPRDVSYAAYVQTRYCLSRLVDRVDEILCDSQWTLDTLKDRYPNARASVIRPGVPEFRSRVLPDGPGVNGLYVSRYERYKGFEIIPGLLNASDKTFSLSVVTDSVGKRFLEESAATFVGSGRLRIYRAISDFELARLFASSHVYLHFSRFEGFCFPVAEALSQAIPVVFLTGSAVGELVSDRCAIGLYIGDSVQKWYEAIQFANGFNADPSFLSTLSEHHRKLPTWQRAAEQLAQVYARL